MIDWVSAKVPFQHFGQLHGGRKIEVTPDGEVKYDSPMWKRVEGSYSANISIKTVDADRKGNGTVMAISGNPVKWFQGHNIFGSDDLCGLVYETMLRVCSVLEIQPHSCDIQAWRHGDFSLSRIDINGMYSLGSRSNSGVGPA